MHFNFDLDNNIIVKCLANIDVGATGGKVWTSSFVLCQYLRDEHYNLHHHPEVIMELGAGCGLCGLVAAMLYPEANVWLTDIDFNGQLELLQSNIQLNSLDSNNNKNNKRIVNVTELNWSSENALHIFGQSFKPDLILCSDILLCAIRDNTEHELYRALVCLANSNKKVQILFCFEERVLWRENIFRDQLSCSFNVIEESVISPPSSNIHYEEDKREEENMLLPLGVFDEEPTFRLWKLTLI